MKSIDFINDGGHVEKKKAENFVKIIYILEENVKGAENKSDTACKDKKDDYGNRCKECIAGYVRRILADNVENYDEAHKNQQGNAEGYEV